MKYGAFNAGRAGPFIMKYMENFKEEDKMICLNKSYLKSGSLRFGNRAFKKIRVDISYINSVLGLPPLSGIDKSINPSQKVVKIMKGVKGFFKDVYREVPDYDKINDEICKLKGSSHCDKILEKEIVAIEEALSKRDLIIKKSKDKKMKVAVKNSSMQKSFDLKMGETLKSEFKLRKSYKEDFPKIWGAMDRNNNFEGEWDREKNGVVISYKEALKISHDSVQELREIVSSVRRFFRRDESLFKMKERKNLKEGVTRMYNGLENKKTTEGMEKTIRDRALKASHHVSEKVSKTLMKIKDKKPEEALKIIKEERSRNYNKFKVLGELIEEYEAQKTEFNEELAYSNINYYSQSWEPRNKVRNNVKDNTKGNVNKEENVETEIKEQKGLEVKAVRYTKKERKGIEILTCKRKAEGHFYSVNVQKKTMDGSVCKSIINKKTEERRRKNFILGEKMKALISRKNEEYRTSTSKQEKIRRERNHDMAPTNGRALSEIFETFSRNFRIYARNEFYNEGRNKSGNRLKKVIESDDFFQPCVDWKETFKNRLRARENYMSLQILN